MVLLNMFSKRNLFSTTYLNGKRLGSGATSSVFECFNRKTNRKFAVKKIIAKTVFQYSKMEEHHLECLRGHPNICTLHDIFYHDDFDANQQYVKHIVTDCGEGDLARLVDTIYMDESTLKIFVEQMLRAILHCHNNNICHRDIKLENFIYNNCYNLSPSSAMFPHNTNIKLIDFGFAMKYNKDYNLKGRVGTYSYVAPEILCNYTYTPKIDSWSLGVCVYKMVIGNPPRTDIKQLTFDPQYNNKQWALYSDPCRDFVEKLLNIDVNKRISIADALNHAWITA